MHLRRNITDPKIMINNPHQLIISFQEGLNIYLYDTPNNDHSALGEACARGGTFTKIWETWDLVGVHVNKKNMLGSL